MLFLLVQTLTPNMQSPAGDSRTGKGYERLLGPALGDRKQGDFSIKLWKNAFHDALIRLCPVRAGGHECGCLPVLARKVSNHNAVIPLLRFQSMKIGVDLLLFVI